MKPSSHLVVWSLVLASLAAAATASEHAVETLPTRPGVTTEVLFITQPGAVANVVLFAGGAGKVTFHGNGEPNGYAGNFLVRSRDLFVKNGLNVAIPGAPSDRPDGLSGRDRISPEHAADIAAIIASFRKRASLPTWVVGTSMGSYSVFAAAVVVKEGRPDGIVFNAAIVTHPLAVSRSPRLGQITLPVLIQHHELDECNVTLFRDLRPLVDGIANSPRKKVVSYRDGGPPKGDPCQPFGYHGFPGIEPKVVEDIARFIKGD